jgi:methylated-DNA-[protein]-cysteine S-methyltransferase
MSTPTFYDRVPGPLGTMWLVTDGRAMTGLYFEGQKHLPAFTAEGQACDDVPVLRAARAQLAAYFAGELRRFDLPLAPAGTPFQRAVWSAIGAVPCGETIAYGELAARAGYPASVRAVGAAVGRNPLSIVIPCHRIIGADGRLTGYAGGLDRKRALLALEAGAGCRGLARAA